MRKLFLLSLLLVSPLFALPIGNPMDASLYSNGLVWGDCCGDRCCDPCDPCFSWCDAWSFRLGFYGDYVYNRHLKRTKGGVKGLNDAELYTNAALLALNICDRVDVFATLGESQLRLLGDYRSFFDQTSLTYESLDSKTKFSWSVGGRLTIWNCDCFYFGAEGQYFSTNPSIAWEENMSGIQYDTGRVHYREWQAALGASYLIRVGCSGISVIPYTAVTWSVARLTDNTTQGPESKFHNGKLWGWGLGTTIAFCDAFGVTVEGRWGNEKAFHLNGQFRF